MILTLLFANIINMDIGWYPLIIPGIIAYNVHREGHSRKDLVLPFLFNLFYFIFIVAVAFISIYFI